MSARLLNLACAMRAVPILAPLLLLSDCGPTRNQFAPVCPRPAFLDGTADLDRYRTSGPGPHDLTELVLHARMLGVAGECKPGETKSQIVSTLTVGIEFTRGPSMAGRQANVLYFVALVDGTTILDKRVFTTQVTFPANVDRFNWISDDVGLVLPVSPSKSAAAYTILVGFQYQTQ